MVHPTPAQGIHETTASHRRATRDDTGSERHKFSASQCRELGGIGALGQAEIERGQLPGAKLRGNILEEAQWNRISALQCLTVHLGYGGCMIQFERLSQSITSDLERPWPGMLFAELPFEMMELASSAVRAG